MAPRIGAVIVFEDGVTKEDVIEFLNARMDKAPLIKSYEVDGFDPAHGSPVFYVP